VLGSRKGNNLEQKAVCEEKHTRFPIKTTQTAALSSFRVAICMQPVFHLTANPFLVRGGHGEIENAAHNFSHPTQGLLLPRWELRIIRSEK